MQATLGPRFRGGDADACSTVGDAYSTVTDLARFLGLSTSLPRSRAA